MHGTKLGPANVVSAAAGGDARIASLSVVMPAFNEEAVLPIAIAEAVKALDRICLDWELIVVDDGSTDGTARVVEGWAARECRVRLLRFRRNKGYGRAIARGLAAARFDAVFYTDADAQFDLAEIPSLFEHLEEVDMVVGFRQHRRDAFIRRFASTVYNTMQRWVLGVRAGRDVNCAFKLFNRRFLDRVQTRSRGFLIDAEFFARAQQAGLTWREVGVTHRPRDVGSSSVRMYTVYETLRDLRRLKRNLGA